MVDGAAGQSTHPQRWRAAGAALDAARDVDARLATVPGYSLGRQVISRTMSADLAALAAALAYHFFLALFPFAIFVTTLSAAIARVFGLPDVAEQMLVFLGQMPAVVGGLLERQLQAAVATNAPRLLSLSALGTLWVATAGTSTLLFAVDRAYNLPGAKRELRRMLLSVGLTVLAGWLLVCSFLAVTLLPVFGRQLLAAAGLPEDLLGEGIAVAWPLAGVVVLLTTTGVYRLAPSTAPAWRHVLPGAGLFTIGWLVGTIGYAIYVTYFATYGLTYGALAAVVALLVWLYLTATLMLAGAVLNAALGEQATPAGQGARGTS